MKNRRKNKGKYRKQKTEVGWCGCPGGDKTRKNTREEDAKKKEKKKKKKKKKKKN